MRSYSSSVFLFIFLVSFCPVTISMGRQYLKSSEKRITDSNHSWETKLTAALEIQVMWQIKYHNATYLKIILDFQYYSFICTGWKKKEVVILRHLWTSEGNTYLRSQTPKELIAIVVHLAISSPFWTTLVLSAGLSSSFCFHYSKF